MKRLTHALILLALPTAAVAGNTLIADHVAVSVAKSPLTVKPDHEWNKMGARPGRNSETWTLDGASLNDLTFYGGIADGQALFREIDKHDKPLPRFSATMLLTEVPALVENSYRVALGTATISMDRIAPATLGGSKGVRFDYSFTNEEQGLRRRGEGYAAIIGGKLYMITFEAPALYYFDAGVGAARQVVASATLPR